MQLTPEQIIQLKEHAVAWAAREDVCMVLDNNFCENAFGLHEIELVIASGAASELASANDSFEELKSWMSLNPQSWLFGFFTYDLKNQVERLSSSHPNGMKFPALYFFKPHKLLVIDKDGRCVTGSEWVDEILNTHHHYTGSVSVSIEQKVNRDQYIKDVEAIRQHIMEGDVYELNYCVEFFAKDVQIDPLTLYARLKQRSPVPFGGWVRYHDQYLVCASPERFMMKKDDVLYSQPIKGTAKRGNTAVEDEQHKAALFDSEKERAENLMIVDLVRNDMARSAETGTVKVEELYGIYTFPQVHQMISTVSAKAKKDMHAVDMIRHAFPMGSMTGAPKIMAMQLIEQYEQTRRGLYSGAIGYFTPSGDFDFNVVIRSIQYNAADAYLSFEVGGAITFDSDPALEYEECLLKAKAIRETLGGLPHH